MERLWTNFLSEALDIHMYMRLYFQPNRFHRLWQESEAAVLLYG